MRYIYLVELNAENIYLVLLERGVHLSCLTWTWGTSILSELNVGYIYFVELNKRNIYLVELNYRKGISAESEFWEHLSCEFERKEHLFCTHWIVGGGFEAFWTKGPSTCTYWMWGTSILQFTLLLKTQPPARGTAKAILLGQRKQTLNPRKADCDDTSCSLLAKESTIGWNGYSTGQRAFLSSFIIYGICTNSNKRYIWDMYTFNIGPRLSPLGARGCTNGT